MAWTPKQVLKKYDSLKSDRGTWESNWNEVGDYVIPRRGNYTVETAQGQKRGTQLLDNTALISCELLAGALHGLLTNPAAQFFELLMDDDTLNEDPTVRTWLQNATRKMHRTINNSNFQTEVHELYLDLVSIGTACMAIEPMDSSIIVTFSTKHLKEVMLEEDSMGYIKTVLRLFRWTAQQIVEKWGESKLPDAVKKAYKENDSKQWEIVHAAYPNPKIPGDKGPAPQFPFTSQYVLREKETELEVGGFKTFPYVSPRWAKASGESYGRGPGMTALPEAKMMNAMTQTVLVGAQKAVDPPLQAPDDGFNMQVITKPGGMSYYRAGSEDRIQPIYNDTRIDFGFEAMKERRARIREAFYVDQLQLQNGPQMTATEVMQRTEEQSRLLGPMLGRQQVEFLAPMIERVFGIMQDRNQFDPMPDVMKGKALNVRYSSMIARAQRVDEGQNILRLVQAINPFVNMDQTIMDNVNGDEVFKAVAGIYNFPQKAMHTDKQVEQIRSARQQAQAEQMKAHQQAQQADAVAKVTPAIQNQNAQIRNS